MPYATAAASAAALDTEASVFAAPQSATWHKIVSPTVIFASEEEMRFGPVSYTPAQRLVLSQAAANRTELSAPRLRRG